MNKKPRESGHSSKRQRNAPCGSASFVGSFRPLPAPDAAAHAARARARSGMVHVGKSMGNLHWLLVLTCFNHLEKYESQLGDYSHILRKIKNVWNHQPVQENSGHMGLQTGFMMVGFGFELWIFTSFSWMKPGDIQGFSPTVPFNHLWRCLIFLGNLALVKIFKMALDWSTHAYQETNALTVLPTSLGMNSGAAGFMSHRHGRAVVS